MLERVMHGNKIGNVVLLYTWQVKLQNLPNLFIFPILPSAFPLYYTPLNLSQCHCVSHHLMASSSLTLFFCLFISLLSLSSSLNLSRLISSQSNGFDLLSFSYTTLSSSLNLDRPSLAADDIHDLLPLYGFPKGLLPINVKSYTLSDDGDFTVDLISRCYVHFPDQIVFYDKKIAGRLSYGSVKDVQGIQAKEVFFWVPITAMESDPSSGTIVFSVGFVSKTLPASMFENVPSCSTKLNLQSC